MGQSFKIKVVMNDGEQSIREFGKVGTIHKVVDGGLRDLKRFNWTNDGRLFENVHDVNDYFHRDSDWRNVKFELVEEGVASQEQDDVSGNFKVKVVKILNDCPDVLRAFEGEGAIFEVVNGKLKDLEGFTWSNNDGLFANIDEVNNYFLGKCDTFRVEFELASEDEKVGITKVMKRL